MSNVLGTLFGDIAAAIRAKTGDAGKMKPAEFPGKILSIVAGGGDKTLEFATGEFQVTTAGVKKVTHNLGVTPDIVMYFLSLLDEGATLTKSSNIITGEIAFSAEMIKDGAVRKFYLINGSSFGASYGINEKPEWDDTFLVSNANPEWFTLGTAEANYFFPNAKYRWVAIGGLKTHNEFYTARFYDGETLLKTEVVPFATVVTPPTPEKEGYALSWSPSDMTVKQDTDFLAVWEEIKRWTAVRLSDYETETSGTYQVSVGSECYVKPCVQFIQDAGWTGAASAALDETKAVFTIGNIVEGKTSITFTENVAWTSVSGTSNTTDCLYIYVNWFDKDGNFLSSATGYTTGKFSGASNRIVSKTLTIPDGAHYVGVVATFGGYASSCTFGGISATLKMVVS